MRPASLGRVKVPLARIFVGAHVRSAAVLVHDVSGGAESAVKGELARRWPAFRFAYSRPGFLTFKLPHDHALAADFDLDSVFARAYAFSVGKAAGGDLDALAGEVWRVWGSGP